MPITVTNNHRASLTRPVKNWAFLWKVTRQDREKFYWTDHDEEIPFNPDGGVGKVIYSPIGGVNVEAVRKTSDGSRAETSLKGAIQADNVTADDVRGGKWRKAFFEQYLIDWTAPFKGTIIKTNFFAMDAKWDAERFEFAVEGVMHFMQASIGRVASRACDRIFGATFGRPAAEVGCRFDIASDSQTDVQVDTVDSENRIIDLLDASITTKANGYYDLGTVTFVTGANAGCPPLEIKSYNPTGEIVKLNYPAPFNVASGDRLTISRGCDHEWDSCVARSQTANFAGHRHIPSEAELKRQSRSRD